MNTLTQQQPVVISTYIERLTKDQRYIGRHVSAILNNQNNNTLCNTNENDTQAINGRALWCPVFVVTRECC
jgi:hypothetical protein